MIRKTFRHCPIPTDRYPPLEATESAVGRVYVTPAGDHYPSMTTVLGVLPNPALDGWRKALGEAEATRQAGIKARQGTALHDLAERYLRNELTPMHLRSAMPNIRVAFSKLSPLLDELDDIEMIEAALYSDVHKIAGRTDVIGSYERVRVIGDFKTHGEEIYLKDKSLKYFTQAYGYREMFNEKLPENEKHLAIKYGVLFFTSIDYEPLVMTADLDDYKEHFEYALDYYRKSVQ